MRHDIFISFSFYDQKTAENIVNLLNSRYGITSWICTRDLSGGEKYKHLIPEAIDTARAVVFIQSFTSLKSREVPKEIGIAFDAEKPIIPFRLDETPLKGALRYDLYGIQYIDATVPSFEERVAELAETLRPLLGDCNDHQERSETNAAARQVTTQYYYLSSTPISWSEIFFGRERELHELHEAFTQRNTVFLRGMGGIGKSELACQYYRLYKDEYDSIVFARYTDSIEALLANDDVFSIEGMVRKTRNDGQKQTDAEYAQDKLRVLREITNTRTLIILDNFDVVKDPLLDAFAQGNPYRLIVTSRCEPERGRYFVLPVKEIGDEALKDMVIDFANPEVTMIERDDPAFPQLFSMTNRHTLTLELIARYMEEKCIDELGEMTDILKQQKLSVFDNAENECLSSSIRNLFRMTELSEDERKFLRYLALMQPAGIDQKLFRSWCGDIYLARPRLASLSLIHLDRVSKTVSLHPIVRQVVLTELTPTIDNCSSFLQAFMTSTNLSWSWPAELKQSVAACGDNMMSYFGELNEDNFDLYYSISTLKNFVCNYQQVMPLHRKLYDYAIAIDGRDSFRSALVAHRAGWFCKNVSTAKTEYWLENRAYPIMKKHEREALTSYTQLLTNLGTLHTLLFTENGDEQELDKAEQWLDDALAADMRAQEWAREDGNVFAENNLKIKYAGVQMAQADLAYQRKEYEKAEELLLDARERIPSADLTDLTEIRSSLAKIQMKLGNYETAATELERVRDDYAIVFPGMNAYSMNTLIILADCYDALGDIQAAKKNLEEAARIAKVILTPDHLTNRMLQERLMGKL